VDGALLRAALVASCFLGAFPPVDFLAVCLVRAIWFDCKVDKVAIFYSHTVGTARLLLVKIKNELVRYKPIRFRKYPK
jgi:hypothetical protein